MTIVQQKMENDIQWEKLMFPDIAQTQWIKELASTGKNFIEESQVLNEGKEKLTQKLEEIKLDNEKN